MMDQFYAHTKSDLNGTPRPQDEWEPLFSKVGQFELQNAKVEK